MRSLSVALLFFGLTACGVSSTADDGSRSTVSAEDRRQADERTCVFPMVTSVIRRAPLFMIDATTIVRSEVFWWHGVPQPSGDDPTATFAIDRHDEDADGVHYQGHEVGATAAGRVITIDLPRRSPNLSIGTAKVSAPGQPDEVIDLRTSEPCSDL